MENLYLLAQNPDTTYSNPNVVTNPILGKGLQSFISGNNPIGFFNQFIPKLIGFMFIIGSISFFFMLLWGAVSWILSGGDKAHIESAKGRITSALVGFILLIGSFAIVKLIEAFFGIDILLIDIGPLIIQ